MRLDHRECHPDCPGTDAPELSADIGDRGIVLTGGGSLLKNLDEKIHDDTGLSVTMASDPMASAVLGTGKMMEDFKMLRKVALN